MFDWVARALSGYYSKKVEVPQEIVEGLWTYLKEILHSKKLCNVLSTGKTINIPPAFPQVSNAQYKPISDFLIFVLDIAKLHTVFKCLIILLNILVPLCLTLIVYTWMVKTFIVQKQDFFFTCQNSTLIRYNPQMDSENCFKLTLNIKKKLFFLPICFLFLR